MKEKDNQVLRVLAKQYPSIAAASTEIINLQSIMNLPKGTEHFLTDIHGEYEQFNHVLKNGSGSVRKKIDEEFGNTISSRDKKSLATLIYYPEEKLEIVRKEEDNLEDWYKISLHRLRFGVEAPVKNICNNHYRHHGGAECPINKVVVIYRDKLAAGSERVAERA